MKWRRGRLPARALTLAAAVVTACAGSAPGATTFTAPPPSGPPTADISGQWGGHLTTSGLTYLDSVALSLHQAATGGITGDGARFLIVNQPDSLVVSGRRNGSAIELYLTTTLVPPMLGPDTIRAEIGDETMTGEYISGPFAQAITLRRR